MPALPSEKIRERSGIVDGNATNSAREAEKAEDIWDFHRRKQNLSYDSDWQDFLGQWFSFSGFAILFLSSATLAVMAFFGITIAQVSDDWAKLTFGVFPYLRMFSSAVGMGWASGRTWATKRR